MEKYLKRAVLGVIYCTVFSLSIVLSSPAHPRSFEWVKLLGTALFDWGFGVAADKSGNIYVTGDTNGDLGGKTNAGRTDAFLARYNSSGTRQWVKQLGTASYFDATYGRGVAADKSGNIYVTGTTSGDLNNETNSGEGGAFLAKYDSSGTMQWVKLLGSVADDQVGVTTDETGNIYVTGSTAVDLGGEAPVGGADAFLAKYDGSGTMQWVKLLGTASDEWGFGVAVDMSGNIYITGDTKGGLGGETNAGYYDAFLAKYDSLGTMQWVKLLGTAHYDEGTDVAVDTSGNIYVTGETEGDLGGETNAGGTDAFLAKYNSSGTMQWVKLLGTASDDGASGVAADKSGNIYVTGGTNGDLGGEINTGYPDVFLAKYDSLGKMLWVKLLGTSMVDGGDGVAVDKSGNIYVTGFTMGDLGGETNAGGYDAFLAKYKGSSFPLEILVPLLLRSNDIKKVPDY